MMPSALSATFMALSGVGFLLLWGNMAMNGSSDAMLRTAASGVFPDGTTIDSPHRTGVWPLDMQLNVLIAFFSSALPAPGASDDATSFFMVVDLATVLLVINLMVTVESRRRRTGFWMRSPAVWQFLWNFMGAAVVFPVWALLKARQRARTSRVAPNPMPAADAVVLPLTAVLVLVFELPLIVPAFLGAEPWAIQRGIVCFSLGPLVSSAFQTAAAWVAGAVGVHADGGEKSRANIRFSYRMLAGVSGFAHLACMLVALCGLGGASGLAGLARLYMPNGAAVYAADPTTRLSEAALLFLQWDYVVISLTLPLLGVHLLRTGERRGKKGDGLSVAVMLAATAVLGPGVGLAYAACCEEGGGLKED